MSEKIYQTIGTVIKEERLKHVENETFTNILLLEPEIPFPGYHGSTVPDKLESVSIFAITKLMYKDERIIRSIQKVKQNLSLKFDAAPGSLHLQNKEVHFIRFKYLPYRFVGDVIDEFKKYGLGFKRGKKVTPYSSIIRVHKYFELKKSEKGIYVDMKDKHMAYLQIPCPLRWVTFRKMTLDIRYNIQDPNYDAALTSIYTEKGLMDLVRIWDKNVSIEKLRYIREKYLEAIDKIM